MGRLRIALIMVSSAILVSAVGGQDLGELLMKARENMAAQNYDTAKQQLQTIVETNITYAPAYFELSKIALIQDDLLGAQENIDAAIENDPRNEEYRATAERIAVLSSDMSNARRSYDERDYMGAVARYEKVIEDYPTFASAYFGLGMALMMAGRLQEAAEAFSRAQSYNPNDPRYAAALRNLVADKYNEGNRLLRARDWESALAVYQEATELDSSFYLAYHKIAYCQRMMGDNAAALKALDRSIAVEPDYIIAYIDKGDILRREGRLKEAEAVLRAAISHDPKSDEALEGLGAVLRRDRPNEAIELFTSAITINPKNGDVAEYLGEIYSERESWAEAQKYLEQAVQLKPGNHVTAWRLAHVYNELGNYEKAREMAKRSTDLKKTFEYAWYEKGLAEKALGNRQAAIEAFRNAQKGRDASIRRSAEYELKQLESPNR
ncbi:MAG: tetratricopeptide repeat protein [Candidatus Neomarinimicrobiota bacterium]